MIVVALDSEAAKKIGALETAAEHLARCDARIQTATEVLSRFAQFAFQHPNMALVLMIFFGAIALAVVGAVSLILHPTMPKFAGIAIIIAVLVWSTRRR